MPNASLRKAKLLYLQKILLEETDDEHGLTMPQIIARLKQQGIDAERKSIYDDIETLTSFGLDIIHRLGAGATYFIGRRDFELPELLLLTDAVQSSRFLTKSKSQALIDKLQRLTSRHLSSQLDKNLHVEGRIKMQNESIYYNIDTIQEALRHRHRITFKYLEFGIDKRAVFRNDGRIYSENPIHLVYKDEYYYLITFNDNHQDFTVYRVDRMMQINETDEDVTKNDRIKDFNVQEYTAKTFSMFSGDETKVVLTVDRSLVGSVIDRFGKDVAMTRIDDQTAQVHVPIMKSSVFFGWLAQFGTLIKIEQPQSLADEYREYLRAMIRLYESRG